MTEDILPKDNRIGYRREEDDEENMGKGICEMTQHRRQEGDWEKKGNWRKKIFMVKINNTIVRNEASLIIVQV